MGQIWAKFHAGLMNYDCAGFMHLASGMVHNITVKAVGDIYLCSSMFNKSHIPV